MRAPALRRRALLRAALAFGVLSGAFPVRTRSGERVARVVPIRAYKFSYDPDEIVLKANEPVTLELTSSDVVMGFNAPDFAVRATVIPGQVARVRLVPDKPGTFLFHCDVFCGDGHESMDGTLRVEP